MKLTKRRIINIIFLVVWMAFIFYMSGKTAESSTKDSDFVINIINSLGINFSESFGEIAPVIVRKAAHITEYTILSLLIYNVLNEYIKVEKTTYIYCILGVFLYACSDELHQMFVPGRAGRFIDVLIDTTGGIIGVLIVALNYRIRTKKVYN